MRNAEIYNILATFRNVRFVKDFTASHFAFLVVTFNASASTSFSLVSIHNANYYELLKHLIKIEFRILLDYRADRFWGKFPHRLVQH